MVLHTRKKNTRLRGSKTHGYGSMKKHRGGGHRGGRGNAGSGKRADSKKPTVWKTLRNNRNPEQFGFFSVMGDNFKTINAGHLNSTIDKLVEDKKATVSAGVFTINLTEMGIDKLLGAGKVTRKLNVTVHIVTPGAKDKIESVGGSVTTDIVVDKGAVKAARVEKVAAEHAAKKKPKVAAVVAKKEE